MAHEGPTPPGGWFIDRLKSLEREAREMSESAKKHGDVSGYNTWIGIASFLALAIMVYKI